MAKLYWRVKKDGKWTWAAVQGYERYDAISQLWESIANDVEEEE